MILVVTGILAKGPPLWELDGISRNLKSQVCSNLDNNLIKEPTPVLTLLHFAFAIFSIFSVFAFAILSFATFTSVPNCCLAS